MVALGIYPQFPINTRYKIIIGQFLIFLNQKYHVNRLEGNHTGLLAMLVIPHPPMLQMQLSILAGLAF